MTKIAYVLHGNYGLISRAKKQINTLVRSGDQVRIYDGIFNMSDGFPPGSDDLIHLSILEGPSPLVNFLRLFLGFNIKVSNKILQEMGDVDYVVCRELSTLFSGVLVKKRRPATKLIFDSNELSVETHSGMKKWVWGAIQKLCLPYCDTVLHAEENRLKHFVDRYKIDTSKQPNVLIENFPLHNPACQRKRSDKVKVIYFGAIGPHRNIEEMVRAFSDLPEFGLDIVGFGTDKYLEEINDLLRYRKASNIRIMPPIDDSMIYAAFSEYVAGIAFYPHTNLNNYFCAPNKVYQYLQSGLAVITTDNPGLRERLQPDRLGICLKEVTADSIKRGISEIVEFKYQDNITDEIKRKFCWETIESRFLSLFHTSPPASPT